MAKHLWQEAHLPTTRHSEAPGMSRDRAVTTTVAGSPCLPLIGGDLIVRLGLVIHGGHSGVGHMQTQCMNMQQQNPDTDYTAIQRVSTHHVHCDEGTGKGHLVWMRVSS